MWKAKAMMRLEEARIKAGHPPHKAEDYRSMALALVYTASYEDREALAMSMGWKSGDDESAVTRIEREVKGMGNVEIDMLIMLMTCLAIDCPRPITNKEVEEWVERHGWDMEIQGAGGARRGFAGKKAR